VTSKAQRSRGMPRRTAQPQAGPSRMPMVMIGAVIGVVAIAAIVAIMLSSTPSTGLSEPARQPVGITGSALPAFADPASDPAVGQPIPQISGTGLDGQPMTIGPGDGPMAIVLLAHWCHVCQAEVPVLVDYLAANDLPDGVELVALATSIDPARPNYPPSAWLETERWEVATLVDDASSRGLSALGMSSFPSFVFVDESGRVVQRAAGAIGASNFDRLVNAIAP
jgi:hypothetical protein